MVSFFETKSSCYSLSPRNVYVEILTPRWWCWEVGPSEVIGSWGRSLWGSDISQRRALPIPFATRGHRSPGAASPGLAASPCLWASSSCCEGPACGALWQQPQQPARTKTALEFFYILKSFKKWNKVPQVQLYYHIFQRSAVGWFTVLFYLGAYYLTTHTVKGNEKRYTEMCLKTKISKINLFLKVRHTFYNT